MGATARRPSLRVVAQPCRLAAKELRQAAAHSHKRPSSSAVPRMVMRLEYGGASLLCAGHEAEREEIPPNRKRAGCVILGRNQPTRTQAPRSKVDPKETP